MTRVLLTRSSCTQAKASCCPRSLAFWEPHSSSKAPRIGRTNDTPVPASMYLSMYLPTYLSICLFVYLSIYPCTYLPTTTYHYLPTYVSIYLSICPSIYLSMYRRLLRLQHLLSHQGPQFWLCHWPQQHRSPGFVVLRAQGALRLPALAANALSIALPPSSMVLVLP